MSTIKTNTLTGTTSAGSINVTGEGGSTTTNLQQGLTKCMITYNAGTADSGTDLDGVYDSFNYTSLVDRGSTGTFDLNFTNNMGNANYCVNFTGGDFSGTDDSTSVHYITNLATGSYRADCFVFSDGSGNDTTYNAQQVVGDLA